MKKLLINVFIIFAVLGSAAMLWPEVHDIRRVCITIDDLPFLPPPGGEDAETLKKKTALLLATLKKHNIPAVGFVNAGKMFKDEKLEKSSAEYLQMWLDAGMELGNHTYSHYSLNKVEWEVFKNDIIKGETVLKELVEKNGKTLRYFRHPYLHTGMSLEVKKKCETFLAGRGYTIAPVTIDNSEWIFARAFDNAGLKGDQKLRERIIEAYTPYMERKTQYYEEQALKIVKRPISQIFLIHANSLNAYHLEKLILMLKKRGYQFISLEEALKDKAYNMKDTFIKMAGISWLHRWALTMGKRGEFFKGEPVTPEFVKQAAGVKYE